MKNLILPFIMMALFAVGSCGDEASVNPPVDKDITKLQDTLTEFKLKELKDFNLKIPAIFINDVYQYQGQGAGGDYRLSKRDTSKVNYSVLLQPYPAANVYVFYYDSTNNSYIFTWNSQKSGTSYVGQYLLQYDTLSFTVDIIKKELNNIRYRTYYSVSDGSAPHKQTQDVILKIRNAPYTIEKGHLAVSFQDELQNSIQEFKYSSGESYWRSYWYSSHSAGLDTNNKSGSLIMQISLE